MTGAKKKAPALRAISTASARCVKRKQEAIRLVSSPTNHSPCPKTAPKLFFTQMQILNTLGKLGRAPQRKVYKSAPHHFYKRRTTPPIDTSPMTDGQHNGVLSEGATRRQVGDVGSHGWFVLRAVSGLAMTFRNDPQSRVIPDTNTWLDAAFWPDSVARRALTALQAGGTPVIIEELIENEALKILAKRRIELGLSFDPSDHFKAFTAG